MSKHKKQPNYLVNLNELVDALHSAPAPNQGMNQNNPLSGLSGLLANNSPQGGQGNPLNGLAGLINGQQGQGGGDMNQMSQLLQMAQQMGQGQPMVKGGQNQGMMNMPPLGGGMPLMGGMMNNLNSPLKKPQQQASPQKSKTVAPTVTDQEMIKKLLEEILKYLKG